MAVALLPLLTPPGGWAEPAGPSLEKPRGFSGPSPWGQATVNLIWNCYDPASVDHFELHRIDPGNSEWPLPGVPADPDNQDYSYTDSSPLTNTKYTYFIDSIAGDGDVQSERFDIIVPSGPKPFLATAMSGTQVRLNWTTTTQFMDRIEIQRADGATDEAGELIFATIHAPAIGETTFTDNGLTTGSRYRYRAIVYYEDSSGASPTADVCTLLPPKTVTVEPLAGCALRVSWTAVKDATSYRVYRSESADSMGLELSTTEGLTFTDSGLEGAKQYFYRVRACVDAGASAFSPSGSSFTRPAPPVIESVSALSGNRLKIAWPAMRGADNGYQVYRAAAQNTTYTLVGVTREPSYEDEAGLNEAAPYWYKVRTRGALGDSELSEPRCGWTAPNQPSNLVVRPDDPARASEAIWLSWTDNSQKESGFLIERSSNGSDGWTFINVVGAAPGRGGMAKYHDEGTSISEGRHYWYRVTAYLAAP